MIIQYWPGGTCMVGSDSLSKLDIAMSENYKLFKHCYKIS